MTSTPSALQLVIAEMETVLVAGSVSAAAVCHWTEKEADPVPDESALTVLAATGVEDSSPHPVMKMVSTAQHT
jgi:predicted alpha/beta hydrolase family esterase